MIISDRVIKIYSDKIKNLPLPVKSNTIRHSKSKNIGRKNKTISMGYSYKNIPTTTDIYGYCFQKLSKHV
jgi:hypothetical protein